MASFQKGSRAILVVALAMKAVAELARSYTREAIETLSSWCAVATMSEWGMAAQALLDRGWDKPKVEVVSNEAGYVQALKAVAAKLEEQPDNRLV